MIGCTEAGGGKRQSRRRVTLTLGFGILLGLARAIAPCSVLANEIDLTIGGVPFHAARGEVTNERVIRIDGSPIVLATWDERDRVGEFVAHYGISLDGLSLVRVSRASYELGLRYARFDPLSLVPDVEPLLAARPGSRLFLVQFVTQPLEIFDRQIASLGGVVHHYVAQFAYLVEIDPGAVREIESLPYVRWAGAYHPAYRLEEVLLDRLRDSSPNGTGQAGTLPASQVYNVQVLTIDQKAVVADRAASIGGVVLSADAGKVLIEVALTPAQLLEVAGWDEVLFIDRWGAYESDMDIVREIGGANYIESMAGYDGTGVRGEIFDTGFNVDHLDFQGRPLILHGGPVSQNQHGASTSGIAFGDGTGDPQARGMLPGGQGIVADWDNIGLSGSSRYNHARELLFPPYEAVFQSTSGGSPRTEFYTTISAEHDAALFDLDIVFCQSGGNAGMPQFRPQGWAKNVISSGGVYHYDTLDKSDDCWCGGASTGPASDGRVAPTLIHFYDLIHTTTCCEPNSYTSSFGGVSGATPIICGHVGLFFQMWSDGIFGNPVNPDGTVFENRCHMTTAKAMLINTADQYDFEGLSHDKARMHQGWGMPNVRNIYDLRDQFLVIDETDILEPFGIATYRVQVAPERPALKVTMTYADPPGNPAVQIQHRINDLDLRVVAPSGATYLGNVGLMETPWSVVGGSPDTKNTVENVFVIDPEPGLWTIQVEAVELIQDGHLETPSTLDADFALVASPVLTAGTAVSPVESAPPSGLRLAVLGIGAGNHEAMISFDLAKGAPVRLRVFDARGRLITTAFDGRLPPGAHALSWTGLDDAGTRVGAGVYFVQLEAGELTASAKLLVVR